MKYNLVSTGDTANVTVFVDGEMFVADSTHPNFKAIIAAVVADDNSVIDLFDTAKAVAEKFEKVSERVSVAGGQVYFDGDLVDNSLTQQIVRFMNEGLEDWQPLVKFYENVAANPNEHSRTQLFEWLNRRDFTITSDGNILTYKALYKVDENGKFKSSSSGSATVNGEAQTGQIVQSLGDVVEMPRSNVQHDPSMGCHTGLHVGSWDYASTFLGTRGTVVSVIVNPRDIVSVPTDCDAAKVRTCRYVLHEVVQEATQSAVYEVNEYDDGCANCSDSLCCDTMYCDSCYDDQNSDYCYDCENERYGCIC